MDGNGHMMTMMMIVAMTTMVVVMMIVSDLNVESTIVDGWMALDTINSVHKLLRGPDRLAFYFQWISTNLNKFYCKAPRCN